MILGIYGTGGLGREILIHSQQINHRETCWDSIIFIDDYAKSDHVLGIKAISFEEVKKLYNNQSIEIAIAVGEPGTRHFLREKVTDAGYSLPVLVHPDVFIPDSTVLGMGTIVRINCFVSCNVTTGENVLIQPNASVGHDNVIGNDSVISTNVCVAGGCHIGSETFIGIQVPVKEYTKIGNQSIISMGSVVVRDIPDQVIAVGNPARPMKNNDEHKVFK